MGEKQPYNYPCKKCGNTDQVLMIAKGRKSIYCRSCSNFEDIYVSTELQRQWDDEAKCVNQSQQQINVPKCPTCQSTNIKPISGLNRGASIVVWGIFSKKINKSFECLNCKYTW